MEWTNMMKVLSAYHEKATLTFFWENGLILDGVVDSISETSNCLDDDDPSYLDYYMAVVEIINIAQLPEKEVYNERAGDLIEVSVLNEPYKIKEKYGDVIWQKAEYDTSREANSLAHEPTIFNESSSESEDLQYSGQISIPEEPLSKEKRNYILAKCYGPSIFTRVTSEEKLQEYFDKQPDAFKKKYGDRYDEENKTLKTD